MAPAVVEHGAAPEPRVPAVLSHPGASCRRYDGGVLLTRTALAHHGRSVLPESFRWFLDTDPAVSGLRDTGNGTGRLEPTAYDDARSAPPDAGQDEHLAGSFYHFGYENPGHFGHLMTEALSRLWAWPEAKRADPGLKVLCRHHPRRHRPGRAALERTLLIAFGVAPEDLVWTGGRTHVDTLVGCTPLWHNTVPLSAHVAIRDTWQRLGDGLRDRAGDAARVERVFVTRRAAGHNRTCHNVGEVERLAEEEGYTVVEPERLSLPDQAALFGGARVVAGLGGAGMFNTALATRLEKIVVLNHTGYHARNEHLVAAVLGAESETFWSEPDMLPRHERDYRAHQSAWSVDLGRHEAGIRRALRTA
ncbi:MAG: hypothetical protein CMH83_13195 [Nocardioides sp.]|nr:hypothetical protein [Nocardioides sp.]